MSNSILMSIILMISIVITSCTNQPPPLMTPEPIPEPQPEWVDFDFGWEPTYAEQLEDSSEPPIEESVLFQGERRVTLMELVGALEDARNLEAERKERLERRRQLRDARQSVLTEIAERLGGKLHNDDPSQYKEKVW